jgi:DNA-binding GntR family transcriptional regulator
MMAEAAAPTRFALESPQPRYLALARALSAEIANGTARAGDRLPGERELGRRFGVSRVTVRRALMSLRADGVVQAAGPRGWFVKPNSVGEPNALMSFSEMARAKGLVPGARILEQIVRPATLDESDVLAVAPGSPLLELRRLRLLNGIPVGIEHTRLPLSVTEGLVATDFSTHSLYDSLRAAGVVPTRSDNSIEAIPATEDQAALLGLERGSPLLLAEATTYDEAGRPVEISQGVFRGDRYRFRTTLYSAWGTARSGGLQGGGEGNGPEWQDRQG